MSRLPPVALMEPISSNIIHDDVNFSTKGKKKDDHDHYESEFFVDYCRDCDEVNCCDRNNRINNIPYIKSSNNNNNHHHHTHNHHYKDNSDHNYHGLHCNHQDNSSISSRDSNDMNSPLHLSRGEQIARSWGSSTLMALLDRFGYRQCMYVVYIMIVYLNLLFSLLLLLWFSYCYCSILFFLLYIVFVVLYLAQQCNSFLFLCISMEVVLCEESSQMQNEHQNDGNRRRRSSNNNNNNNNNNNSDNSNHHHHHGDHDYIELLLCDSLLLRCFRFLSVEGDASSLLAIALVNR